MVARLAAPTRSHSKHPARLSTANHFCIGIPLLAI